MTGESHSCFICCGEATPKRTPSTSKNNFLNKTVKIDSSPLLSNNLNVIFVLRNFLQVPSILLENELQECEQDPQNWIRLCDQCIHLTKKGRQLYVELCKIEKQLRCVQKQVVEKLKSSRLSQQDYDSLKQKAYQNRSSLTFEDKISLFVKTHNYPYKLDGRDDNDTAGSNEGDKLANYLSSQQNSKILLIEKDANEVAQEDVKLEVESPPSSPPPPPDSLGCSPQPSEDDDDDDDVEYTIKVKVKRKTTPGNQKRSPSSSSSTSASNQVTPTNGSLKPSDQVKSLKAKKPKHKFELCNCPTCGKQFNYRKSLNDHVRYVHLKKFSIRCPVCEKGFTLNRMRDLHMLTIHKNDPLTLKLKEEKGFVLKRCSMTGCKSFFLTPKEEENHMKRMHPDKVVKGNWEMEEGVGEGKELKGKINEADGQVFCVECGKWYRNWLWWTNHVWKEHQGRDLSCPGEECKGVFEVTSGTMKEFRGHFEMKHEKKKIICNICGKEMLNRNKLKNHKTLAHNYYDKKYRGSSSKVV